MFESYRPESYSDFTMPTAKKAYEDALAAVEKGLGAHRPLIIGGERIDTASRIESVNPCRPGQAIGSVAGREPGTASNWQP